MTYSSSWLERIRQKPILIAIGLVILFWILESVAMSLIFHEGPLIEQIYKPHLHEIWMRLQAMSIIILFGVYVQLDINRRKFTEKKLRDSFHREKELREQLEAEIQKRIELSHALVHELKTPLTPVLASSETLAEGIKEEPWLQLAQNVYRGAINLNDRIDGLLRIAQGELNGLEIKPQSTKLLPLIREVANEMGEISRRNRQTLVLELPLSLPVVNADSSRIKQVLQNLLTNASKFTPEEGKIIIAAKKDMRNVIIEVKDTGVGLTRGESERVFDPYYRNKSNRDHLSGLGLGLTICKNIINLHGGEIWVKSKRGRGSLFGFSLPVLTAA